MENKYQSTGEVAKKIADNRAIPSDPRMYPKIDALLIKNPSRFYAFPIIGGLVKGIMTIPQLIILMVISYAASFITTFINSFAVLFTGKYMNVAYDLNTTFIKWYLKITFFSSGLTDKYPGFETEIRDTFSVSVVKPVNPNKLYAIPILGFVIRSCAMIPFSFWASAVMYAGSLATTFNSFYVLFTGKYSETAFELVRDGSRLYIAKFMYLNGMSDVYPSFSISMNHKNTKIFLIIFGILVYITFTIIWLAIQILSSLMSEKGTSYK